MVMIEEKKDEEKKERKKVTRMRDWTEGGVRFKYQRRGFILFAFVW